MTHQFVVGWLRCSVYRSHPILLNLCLFLGPLTVWLLEIFNHPPSKQCSAVLLPMSYRHSTFGTSYPLKQHNHRFWPFQTKPKHPQHPFKLAFNWLLFCLFILILNMTYILFLLLLSILLISLFLQHFPNFHWFYSSSTHRFESLLGFFFLKCRLK